MICITKEQLKKLHSALIAETGGSDGIRDEGLLEAALAAPFQTYDGIELFRTVEQKAARLAYGLICNHAFIDGNKRIGAHAMLLFLMLNQVILRYTQTELIDEILGVASGKQSCEQLQEWIIRHTVS